MSQPSQQRVGQYNFLRKLGAGRIAEVYLGRIDGAEGFQKPVAIKKILPQFASDPAFVPALITEAKVGGQLHHRNIVEVYDFIRYGNEYCLIMEYVEGVDLSRILKAARQYRVRIPPAVVLYIASQICDGLDYAHSARGFSGEALNIIHRDLKPSNILISTKGGVKISDFGVARVLDQAMSRIGPSAASLQYQSPEQTLGNGRSLTPASDIFSLGSVLYEMLTLEPLLSSRPGPDILERLKEELPRRLALAQRALPGSDKILMAALHPNPAKRYSTAGLMGEDLRRLLVYLKVDDPRERLTHFFWRLVRFIRDKSKEGEDGLDGTAPGGADEGGGEEWGAMSTRVDAQAGSPQMDHDDRPDPEESADEMPSRTNERVTMTRSSDQAFEQVQTRRAVVTQDPPTAPGEPPSEADPWGDVRTRMLDPGQAAAVMAAPTAPGQIREETVVSPYAAVEEPPASSPYDAPADVTTVRPPTHVSSPAHGAQAYAEPQAHQLSGYAQPAAPQAWQQPSPEQTVAVYPQQMAAQVAPSMYETSYQAQPPAMPAHAQPPGVDLSAGAAASASPRSRKLVVVVAALALVLVGVVVVLVFLRSPGGGTAPPAASANTVLCPDGHPNEVVGGEPVKFCGTCGKAIGDGAGAGSP